MPSKASESTGLVGAFFESLRSNADEKVKSPFAGAFLASWLVTNWKAVLILLLSSKEMEQRIQEVATNHFTINSLLWVPLLSSFVVLVCFYVFSLAYLLVSETNELLRGLIEKSFDRFRWIPPDDYIKLKSEYRQKMEDLRQLASDRIEQIARVEESRKEVEDKLEAVKQEAALLQDQHKRQMKVKDDEARLAAEKMKSMAKGVEKFQIDMEARDNAIRRVVNEFQTQIAASEGSALAKLASPAPLSAEGLRSLVKELDDLGRK